MDKLRRRASPRSCGQAQQVQPGALHPNMPRLYKVVETEKAFYLLMVRFSLTPAVNSDSSANMLYHSARACMRIGMGRTHC
jgi:hypothetical protein